MFVISSHRQTVCIETGRKRKKGPSNFILTIDLLITGFLPRTAKHCLFSNARWRQQVVHKFSFQLLRIIYKQMRNKSVDRVAEIRPNTRLDVTNDKKRAVLCKQPNWSNSPRRKTPPIATKKHGLQLNWIGYGPNKTLVDGLCRVCRSVWREIKLHVRCPG